MHFCQISEGILFLLDSIVVIFSLKYFIDMLTTSLIKDFEVENIMFEIFDEKCSFLNPVCSFHEIWKPLGMTSCIIHV